MVSVHAFGFSLAENLSAQHMGLLGASIDAGVNADARGRTKVSLRDVTIVRDEMGDGVPVTSRTGSTQKFVEKWKKVVN